MSTEQEAKDRHIVVTDENNRKWLLRRLSELIDDERDNDKHFVSRVIRPIVIVGEYNSGTGKIVNFGAKLHTINTDTADAATSTWTVPTGKNWIIHAVGGCNSNRAFGLSLSIGGTVRYKTANNTMSQSLYYYVVGGIVTPCINGPIVVSAGTAIVLTDLARQAGDTVSRTIIYTEVDA